MTANRIQRKIVFSVLLIGLLCFSSGWVQAEVHNWAVELILDTTPSSILRDDRNLAAVTQGASDGFDIFDACIDDPIPPGGSGTDELNLSFYHPEYQDLEPGVTSRCSQDTHAPYEATGEWEVLLETNLVDTELVLTWDLQGVNAVVPLEYRVLIVDGSSGAQITLQDPEHPELEASEYRIHSGTSQLARFFLLSVVNAPPPAPESFLADAGAGSVLLSWDASSQPDDVDSFVIRYGTEPGVHPFTLVVGDVEQAVVGDLETGTTYYFRLWARDRTGLEGEPSPELMVDRISLLGDLDSSGQVDYLDLFEASPEWQVETGAEVDFTWDGAFDQDDLLKFEANWHRGI